MSKFATLGYKAYFIKNLNNLFPFESTDLKSSFYVKDPLETHFPYANATFGNLFWNIIFEANIFAIRLYIFKYVNLI